MAAPKMCLDCNTVKFLAYEDARAQGWVSLLVDRWNDLWRCPWCSQR